MADISRREIEDSKHTTKDLAMVCKKLGYTMPWEQLMFPNGASVTNLLEFFDDNPGAVEAVLNWILENGSTRDGEEIPDELEEEDEESEEEENTEEDA